MLLLIARKTIMPCHNFQAPSQDYQGYGVLWPSLYSWSLNQTHVTSSPMIACNTSKSCRNIQAQSQDNQGC
jgi:hypothetical protein